MKNRCRATNACWLVALSMLLATAAWGAQGNFLADRHQGRGAKCESCHKAGPPKAAGTSEACTQCHGNLDKVAAKTIHVKPVNPHVSHMGEVACGVCHQGHKPSVNACAECHPFQFKVP